MLFRIKITTWMLAALLGCTATGVICADPDRKPPHNVSQDPAGREVPTFGLPPGEKVEDVLQAEKVSVQAGEDAVDWSVKCLNAEAAWKKGITGKGVKVAVLDTGYFPHRDLKDGVKGSKDFSRSPNGVADLQGHATHCAGSIGARKNGWGTVGVAYDCDLYMGKVLGDRGSGSVDNIRDGILWAVNDCGADVISMSIGGGGSEDFIPIGLAAAEQQGVIVVAAAGNDGNNRPVNFPAAYPFPLAVSAVDIGLKLANFSCTGAKVEVAGPGVNVRSTYPGPGDGLFADLSGTSMATPNVAGVAALWIQANPKIAKKDRPNAFRKWLKETAKDLGPAGRDTNFGFGLPDCSKLELVDPPVQPPVPTPTPGGGVQIDESDLNDKGKEKLKKGGFEKFKFELAPTTPAKPPQKEAPKLNIDAIAEKLKTVGELIVFVGVEADLTKYPDGVLLTDELEGIPPGVYKTKLITKVGFTPIK